ncbi:uncharacterized protein LOC142973902 [Anticarsia gemmatalis]|uniref:uncharacterized protein LOC142973902 n=1 Tax=Anticarsia gemmatalis TaxID=129554 RepID=UPI003F774AA9
MMSSNFVFFTATATLFTISSAAPSNDGVTKLTLPEECQGKEFCHIKPDGYTELEDLMNSKLPSHLIQRSGDKTDDSLDGLEVLSDESDWHNCRYTTTKKVWYLRVKKNSVTQIIIQTKLLRQEVVEVKCEPKRNARWPCFEDLLKNLQFLKSSCVTGESSHTLYFWDMDKEEVVAETVQKPSSCSCMVSYI